MTQEEMCTLALGEFEVGNYRTCVEHLIEAYEQDGDKLEILNFLYQNFVYPNESEFRETYKMNYEYFWGVEYEDLALDFIPVSDEEFFLYDREYEVFLGILDLKELSVQKQNLKDPFSGYVFADIWDVRDILPYVRGGSEGQLFYLVTSDVRRTAAFGKIPNLMDMFLKNTLFLQDLKVFRELFKQNLDFYIPKMIVAGESLDTLSKMINDLHKERIESVDVQRKNILLSICIPSYNRGGYALKNVRHLLDMCYDSEIEIILSNNGSTENIEGYEEIKKIKDSRLRYHEFDENAGFAGNVLQVLRMAQGKYAVLFSDEDLLIRGNLPYYLKILQEAGIKGVLRSSGSGTNMCKYQGGYGKLSGDRIEHIFIASNLNYLTGIFLNMETLRECDCLDIVKSLMNYECVIFYPHNAIAVMLAYDYGVYGCGKELWMAGEDERLKGEIAASAYPIYVTLETRKKLFEDWMMVAQELFSISGKELCELYKKMGRRVWELLEVGYQYYPQYYEEKGYTTEIVMEKVRNICIEDIKLIRENITEVEKRQLETELHAYDFFDD